MSSLTGRQRGGNGDPVLFEGRHMSLHGMLCLLAVKVSLETYEVMNSFRSVGHATSDKVDP